MLIPMIRISYILHCHKLSSTAIDCHQLSSTVINYYLGVNA